MPVLSNKMTVSAYEPSLEMAFSDSPVFPESQEEAAQYGCEEVLEIEEWQTFYARFYSNQIPSAIAESKCVVNRYPGFIELNFGNFVGLSRLGKLRLRIINRKISADVYEAMLDELAERYASLIFSFGTPVGQHYQKSGLGRDASFIEYLFLRKFLLNDSPDIEAIGSMLAYEPHRIFVKEIQTCPIDQCLGVNSGIIQTLTGGPVKELAVGHPLAQTGLGTIFRNATGRNLFPSAGRREVKTLTVDTYENRFIKFFLESLQTKVEGLKNSLVGRGGGYFNPDISTDLDILHQKISHVLSHNMWRDVGAVEFIPGNSQILQRKDGYSQLFKLYSLLQLATRCDFLATDFQDLIEIKDLPTLYEYWCFFQVKSLMDTISKAQSVSRIISDSPLQHDLTKGLRVEYENGAALLFNHIYSGSPGIRKQVEPGGYNQGDSYSHKFRPDIVIEYQGRKLIFDAKYKGKRSGFYGSDEQGVIESWKDEDIDKMHSYHDAIRDVAGSFVLYPGNLTIVYPVHGSTCTCEGVGAISLKPGTGTIMVPLEHNLTYKIIASFLKIGREDLMGKRPVAAGSSKADEEGMDYEL
jgi:hypothetical protein